MGLFSKKANNKANELKDANFYFYFGKDNKPDAEKAEKELAQKGFKTDLHWLDHEDGQWSLTLNKKVAGLDEIIKLEDDLLEDTAKKYNGEYDGHEIAI